MYQSLKCRGLQVLRVSPRTGRYHIYGRCREGATRKPHLLARIFLNTNSVSNCCPFHVRSFSFKIRNIRFTPRALSSKLSTTTTRRKRAAAAAAAADQSNRRYSIHANDSIRSLRLVILGGEGSRARTLSFFFFLLFPSTSTFSSLGHCFFSRALSILSLFLSLSLARLDPIPGEG